MLVEEALEGLRGFARKFGDRAFAAYQQVFGSCTCSASKVSNRPQAVAQQPAVVAVHRVAAMITRTLGHTFAKNDPGSTVAA